MISPPQSDNVPKVGTPGEVYRDRQILHQIPKQVIHTREISSNGLTENCPCHNLLLIRAQFGWSEAYLSSSLNMSGRTRRDYLLLYGYFYLTICSKCASSRRRLSDVRNECLYIELVKYLLLFVHFWNYIVFDESKCGNVCELFMLQRRYDFLSVMIFSEIWSDLYSCMV